MSSQSSSSFTSACFSSRLTTCRRTMRERICTQAASATPSATFMAGSRSLRRTVSASTRRIRYRLSKCSTADFRMLVALAGVGAFSQSSKTTSLQDRRRGQHLGIIPPELMMDSLLNRTRSSRNSSARRDHARSLINRGSATCRRRNNAAVGSNAVRQDLRIPAVILRTGDAEPVAQTVELFGIDRVDAEFSSTKVSTTGPCGTSIATVTALATRVIDMIHSSNSSRPAPLCGNSFSPMMLPSASMTQA